MAGSKPNIILITSDQQRFDTVGERAPSFMRTPHFDLLCRQGITYKSAYAQCPACVPSRASILTGKYAENIGAVTNNWPQGVDREKTLPVELRKMGYSTIAVGKMHFKPVRARYGFDEMIVLDDYYREMRLSGNPLQPMRHGLGQNELYPGMSTVPEAMTLTSWITEKCVEYIHERRDPTQPFFMWCSYSKPHPPLDPPEPYYSMYRNSNIPEPVFGDWSEDGICPESFKRFRQRWSCDLLSKEVIREARAAYYGLITQIDYNMGRIFAALQDEDLFKNTLIMYTSDHGEYLGDHNTGAKFFFHEPSAHVPFVIRLPKTWENRCAGKEVSDAITHADIMPTLLAAAGGSCEYTDGLDLIALARNELKNERQYIEGVARNLDAEFNGITDGKWKYIWYPEGGSEQLFDLVNDPMELTNLAGNAEYSDKRNELKQELITRNINRNSPYVIDGELEKWPLKGDSEKERRDRSWPGFHTEKVLSDTQH